MEFGNDAFPSLPNRLRTSTTCVCRNWEVLISDIRTEIDLVIFQISDFDVILVMDLLEKTHARVD